jgi:hypothetical protein
MNGCEWRWKKKMLGSFVMASRFLSASETEKYILIFPQTEFGPSGVVFLCLYYRMFVANKMHSFLCLELSENNKTSR